MSLWISPLPGAERDYAGRLAPDRESHVGEMFGRYRLDAQLGAGGVGEVWRAFDTSLDRVVALKMLLPRFRDDPDSAQRFLREARMAARLRHPHIVHVNNFGEIDDRLYLDMELVGGSSLAAVLATRGPVAPEWAVEVVERVADALDAAHALDDPEDQRMVHRDVKPANVLLEPRPGGREHVYLVDFGVARTVAQGASITGPGSVVGTPSYIAPEIWEGHRADHRIDVYALAVTLFEMVTGTVPFPRSTMHAVLTAHLTAPVPAASTVRPGLPRALDAVIARGMAKDPQHRWPTAGALALAARAALRTTDPAPTTVPWPVPRPQSATTQSATTQPAAPDAQPDSMPPDTAQPDTAPPGSLPPGPLPPGPLPVETVPPDSLPPDTERRPEPPYIASTAHFAGLAAAVLVVPIHLLGVVGVGWSLLLLPVVLYALGAALTTAVQRRGR